MQASSPSPTTHSSLLPNSPNPSFVSAFPPMKPVNASPLASHPLYAPTHPRISLQFKEKVLCLEVMGVDSGRALSLNPSLRDAPLSSINDVISFLQSKGIHHKDLPRILGMCPQVLTSDVPTQLDPIFSFLSRELNVPEENYRKPIVKCPRLLTSSVRDQLKPALFFLHRLGFRDKHALAYQDPVLLVSNVERTLIPKLRFLEGIGFSRDEAVGMVRRCPCLFTFSIENNLRPKLEYFRVEMKGEMVELGDFPQYFTFSLEKRIRPRHEEATRHGMRIGLGKLLKASDEEFMDLIRHEKGMTPNLKT
ncbi:hypothetical protein MLD38_037183 [Melastoma candidum]|uniref:Uncharacterized protein n=1 Tax=Melastoma candidum TaxID=119954 RepID=A0ACB9LMG5_9MYRT|nr:hypothetical protein MLD38_037183 [Melastoma candidum]